MNAKNGYKFYDKDNNILNIISCVNCHVCKEWEKYPWKVSYFCPVHCHLCYYAGYDEEFDIYPDYKNNNCGLFLCLKCIKKVKSMKKPQNILNREIFGISNTRLAGDFPYRFIK